MDRSKPVLVSSRFVGDFTIRTIFLKSKGASTGTFLTFHRLITFRLGLTSDPHHQPFIEFLAEQGVTCAEDYRLHFEQYCKVYATRTLSGYHVILNIINLLKAYALPSIGFKFERDEEDFPIWPCLGEGTNIKEYRSILSDFLRDHHGKLPL